MKNKYIVLLVVAACILIVLDGLYLHKQQKISFLQQHLAECGAFQSGSTQRVSDTSRVFINLPKDIYPDINLRITPHGATASYVSNGGPYGNAFGVQERPNCWSYYFELDGTGTVDVASKSGVSGISDYVIHFIISPSNG